MAERPWMPIFWGDYVRDTLHLTTEQHGAYLLLICSYWVTGRPLPDDDKQLSQVCRMSVKKWKTSCQIVKGFFRQANGHLVHDRIEKELLRCSERSAKARASAQQRARALPDPESDKTQSLYVPSELLSETPCGVDQPDLDALFYQRGKALLGRKAGGVLTNLRKAVGLGAAIQVIDDAQHKESPAEYVAGVIRAKGNGHAAASNRAGHRRGSAVEAARNVLRRLEQADPDWARTGPAPPGDDGA